MSIMKYYSKRGATFTRIKLRPHTQNNSQNLYGLTNNKRFFQRSHHQQFSKKRAVTASPYKRNDSSTAIRSQSCVGHSSPAYEIFTNEGKVAPLHFSSIGGASPNFYFTEKDDDSCFSSWSNSTFTEPKEKPKQRKIAEKKPILKTQENFKRVKLASGAFVVPHPSKAYKGGEDAHFVSDRVLGIADGVGGWADSGVDPALYANKLMQGAKHAVDENNCLTPVQILQAGYDHAQDVVGSSTACIVSIEGNTLKAANLGDSGFMVIRNDSVIFKSKEQQHSFNFPYQLGTGSSSLPCHADSYELAVQPGDLIVMGSDGLFDNMYEEEILELVQSDLFEGDPQLLAQELALAASRLAHLSARISPFAKGAQQANLYFMGGKVDDITAIVSKVVDHKTDAATASPTDSFLNEQSLSSSQEAVVE